MARARCVVAEAEIALVSRDLGWPLKALDAARATLEKHGDWVNAAHARQSRGPASSPDRPSRRGRACARGTRSRAVPAGVAGRPRTGRRGDRHAAPRVKAARAALARAEHAAREAGIPALMAEVESASLVLNTPAARLMRVARSDCSCSRRSKRCWPRRR